MNRIDLIRKKLSKVEISEYFDKALLPDNAAKFITFLSNVSQREDFMVVVYLLCNEYLSISELDISNISNYKTLFDNVISDRKKTKLLPEIRVVYSKNFDKSVSYKDIDNLDENLESSLGKNFKTEIGIPSDMKLGEFFFRVNEKESGLEKYIRYTSYLYNYNNKDPKMLTGDSLFPAIDDYKTAAETFKKALNIINTETINY